MSLVSACKWSCSPTPDFPCRSGVALQVRDHLLQHRPLPREAPAESNARQMSVSRPSGCEAALRAMRAVTPDDQAWTQGGPALPPRPQPRRFATALGCEASRAAWGISRVACNGRASAHSLLPAWLKSLRSARTLARRLRMAGARGPMRLCARRSRAPLARATTAHAHRYRAAACIGRASRRAKRFAC